MLFIARCMMALACYVMASGYFVQYVHEDRGFALASIGFWLMLGAFWTAFAAVFA